MELFEGYFSKLKQKIRYDPETSRLQRNKLNISGIFYIGWILDRTILRLEYIKDKSENFNPQQYQNTYSDCIFGLLGTKKISILILG